MSAENHIHHPNYVKVWGILVALLGVSLLGSMSGLRWMVLIAAFGVAIVKALLVAKNFMHVTIEKRYVPYLMLTCLIFLCLLFAGVSPDVMEHKGLHWQNNSAMRAVQAGFGGVQKR